MNGDLTVIQNLEFCANVSFITMQLLQRPVWDSEDQAIADTILRISNIAYNNTSCDILPLDDGLYDQLLVMYRGYDKNYQVGAPPVQFNEIPQNEIVDEKIMCVTVDKNDMDRKLYAEDIWKQHTPISYRRPVNMCTIVREPISKRLINTTHKYPELVGTLDKCKFVLNNDAVEKGVFDKPAVQVFERDFIQKCLATGVIQPYERFQMVGELKYDGISVEAEVCGDTIISALSRGDTADNIATDLTPILGGYRFPWAKDVPTDITFGMKFEAVMTKRHLEQLGIIRGKAYKNCRNAIIGLFGASDAYKFVDYITLIPLATSLEMDRITELKFLNKYYHSGQYNRYCVFEGDYKSILFQVKQFTESAELIRPVLPYLIDGVVISFIDPHKIQALGRENSVNKYSMAIKFNPKKVRTVFLGFTYSIGKSGEVIPMVHFKPCEFLGGIHTKQTIHSYQRFKELNLARGDEIDVEYINEVITYITKPDTEHNRRPGVIPEQFITKCPYCGSTIVVSESGKSAKCPNVMCHERLIMRMIDMLDRLGFKDFAEESVRTLDFTTLRQVMSVTSPDQLMVLGPSGAEKFYKHVMDLKISGLDEFRVLSALGFDGMGDEKWKTILKHFTILRIRDMDDQLLMSELTKISGIGPKVVQAIIDGKHYYTDDLNVAIEQIPMVVYKSMASKPKVAITGFRDAEFINLLNENGFDASDKYTVTKDVKYLIAADPNSNSSKIIKAKKYGIPIYSKSDFIAMNNIILQ